MPDFLRPAAKKLLVYNETLFKKYQCEYCNGPHGRRRCDFLKDCKEWFGSDIHAGSVFQNFDALCQVANVSTPEKAKAAEKRAMPMWRATPPTSSKRRKNEKC